MTKEHISEFLFATTNESDFQLAPLTGGANNQGYKVSTNSGKTYFLKCFAGSSPSSLDKLRNEFHFVKALNDAGVDQVPQAIAKSDSALCSLFEFISGTPVEEVDIGCVKEALRFVETVNSSAVDKKNIGFASESPKVFTDFIEIINKRLTKFRNASLNGPFLEEVKMILQKIEEGKQAIEKQFAYEVDASWQASTSRTLLSASDFGFHNAIQVKEHICFIDFEYAGMDSCWKLFCDFFAQPARPVPISTAHLFFQHPFFAPLSVEPRRLLAVFKLTLLKWCLIMLNEFLPEVQERRLFSWEATDEAEQLQNLVQVQEKQLLKCQEYFHNIDVRCQQLQQAIQTT